MKKHHTHPCGRCQARVECDDANLEINHDGWPEVICHAIHGPGGVTYQAECELCRETTWCATCDAEPATHTLPAFTGLKPEHYCDGCLVEEVSYRKNYDPTSWDQADVTSGVSASERNDPTHPRNREAWDIKRAR